MLVAAPADGLAGLLSDRDDPMAACSEQAWLTKFAKVPANASVPLAMSGPHPRAVGSYGAECIRWAKAELGLTPRWWQALAITRQLEHDAEGALVWREIVESGPRRIGKSVRLRVTALWRLANAERLGEPQLVMLTSKDLAAGKEIHRGAWRWAQHAGWSVIKLNGGQEIETKSGDRWLLRAPSAVYSYDVGYGQVDESWDVDPQAITDGLEPALLERMSPQLHLTSTAHVKASSLMRRRLISALRDAPDVLLLLWGAHPDLAFDDVVTWRAASPHWSREREALMGRKYAAAVAGQDEPEFDDPDPVRGWAAQYLNVWPLLGFAATGLMPTWPACAVQTEPEPTALGLAMDVDRTWISLGAASTDGERPHVGSVLRRRVDVDREFVVDEAARISRERGIPVAFDRKGPAATLEGALVDRGATVAPLGMDDYLDACASLFDLVEAKALTHGDYADLNAAVGAVGWRAVGDRRAWSRRNGDVSMLEAVTLALGAGQEARSVYETRDLLVL